MNLDHLGADAAPRQRVGERLARQTPAHDQDIADHGHASLFCDAEDALGIAVREFFLVGR